MNDLGIAAQVEIEALGLALRGFFYARFTNADLL